MPQSMTTRNDNSARPDRHRLEQRWEPAIVVIPAAMQRRARYPSMLGSGGDLNDNPVAPTFAAIGLHRVV